MIEPPFAPKFLTTGALDRRCHLLLAHGAGAPMTSPFLSEIADGLSMRGVTVHRFEFAYMAERRTGGRRRPPPKAEHLVAAYGDAIAALRARLPTDARLYAGGKSMGGRIASLAAADDALSASLAGVIVLGYPFHPPGRPHRLRISHLGELRCRALIVQGTRDALGSRAEVEGYELPAAITLAWIDDGDHDLKPRARSGLTQEQAMMRAIDAVATFIAGGD